MKKINYANIIVMLSLCFSHSAQANQNQTQISGYVYNPDREPAIYSTVMLLNKDSVLIKGTFSLDNGVFVFDDITPGEYFIQVRNAEFKTYFSDLISVKPNEKYLMDWIIL